MGFEAKTNELTYVMDIDAPAEEVFPLLCPRPRGRLGHRLEGGVHADREPVRRRRAGRPATQHGDDPPQTWVVTRYEPVERIAFAYFDADVVTRLEIELEGVGGTSRATWTTSHVGISSAGDARLEAMTQERYDASRAGLEVMLQHYLATGEMVDQGQLRQQVAARGYG